MTTTDSPTSADLSRLALEMYQRSAHGAAVRSGELLPQARRVTRWLASVACAQTLLVFVVWQVLNSTHDGTPVLKVAALSSTVMAGLFWLLWLWSKESPLPPAIAALAIYPTLWWVTSAYTFASLVRTYGEEDAMARFHPDIASLIRLIIVFGLLRAVIAGVKHRRLSQRLASVPADAAMLPLEPMLLPADSQPRRLAGITTSLVFYFMLLYVILDIIATWGDNLLTPVMYQKLVMMEVIVILTWSIACWRDVYCPLARTINPLWYLAAIGGGCCTFAIAHGWMHLVRLWAELPSPDVVEMAGTHSWSMQLLLVAVTPAIVEEIAFRGVIFGAFMRSLKGWETVIVTALMFMVLHASVPAFPHLLLGGLLFGLLRLRTAVLVAAGRVHALHAQLPGPDDDIAMTRATIGA